MTPRIVALVVVGATAAAQTPPQPEIEGWIISGFLAKGEERAQLARIRNELSFDPTLESHRLTSHPNTSARDAKRVRAGIQQMQMPDLRGDHRRPAAAATANVHAHGTCR